jgi:hypothetical protein
MLHIQQDEIGTCLACNAKQPWRKELKRHESVSMFSSQ